MSVTNCSPVCASSLNIANVCFAELNCAALVDSRILTAMTWSTRRLFEVLRVSMLTLLVLGIAIRPMLQFVGESHASAHAAAAQVDAHPHAHDESHDEGDHDGLPGDDPVPDHTSGVHGLMHQGNGGGAFSVNTFVMALPEVAFELLAAPLLAPPRAPLQLIEGPFRPPIA